MALEENIFPKHVDDIFPCWPFQKFSANFFHEVDMDIFGSQVVDFALFLIHYLAYVPFSFINSNQVTSHRKLGHVWTGRRRTFRKAASGTVTTTTTATTTSWCVRTLNTYIYVTVYFNSLIVFNNINLCHHFKNRLFDVIVYIFHLSMPLPGPQLSASQLRLQPQPSLRAPPASIRVCVGCNCSQFIIKIQVQVVNTVYSAHKYHSCLYNFRFNPILRSLVSTINPSILESCFQ